MKNKRRCIIPLIFVLCAFTSTTQSASRCTERPGGIIRPARIDCSFRAAYYPSSDLTWREVKWELPLGTPPPGGWPVALIYQGSIFEVEFSRSEYDPFGGFYELKTIKTLLDNGYAVIAPRAPLELAWLTNSAGPLTHYEITTDYTFLNNVFNAIADGDFGPINPQRKYATGISSGGYNTSRMAVTWTDEFKALVVHSGSYATCLGPVCVVPEEMPAGHPPTRFIHGFLDLVVPWWSMDLYYDALLYHGIETDRVTVVSGGHEWFKQSPQAILQWFNAHP